jgi:hypothetical protein
LAADGATARGIPSDGKLESYDEHEILHVSSQSDVEIYIIWSPLKYIPIPMRIAHPWMELIARGIPSDTKLETHPEAEILHVSGQSEVEICIIGSPLKYAPSPATVAHPWTLLQGGQFSQMRN